MSYIKEARGLSQKQVLENLKAVFNSEYFQAYDLRPCKSSISSDILNLDSIGGFKAKTFKPFRVGELTDVVIASLDAIEQSNGILTAATIALALSQERLKAMQFEKRVYKHEDFEVHLTFTAITQDRLKYASYDFLVKNYGFEDEKLNKKLSAWYREVTRNLKKILPYPVRDTILKL